MFTEELAEKFYLAKIKAGVSGFAVVDRIGMCPLDVQYLGEFVRNSPACLVGFTDESVAENQDSTGTIQHVDYTFLVNIIGTTKAARAALSDTLNLLARQTKSALRGVEYTRSDGNTEAVSWLIYQGRKIIPIQGDQTILVVEQTYRLRVQDRE